MRTTDDSIDALRRDAAPLYVTRHPESGAVTIVCKKPPFPALEGVFTQEELHAALKNKAVLRAAIGDGPDAAGCDALLLSARVALAREALLFLPLLHKSGGLICGFEKIRAELRAGGVSVILHAKEASPREARRLNNGTTPSLTLYTAEELGKAPGRGRVTHAAVKTQASRGAWRAKYAALRLFVYGAEKNGDAPG